jgi:acyl-CoA synthetase (AMP-forming)/AMP-acid ligase II
VQIEDYLRTHDAIKDVAVIGLPDHRLGEISAAIVELKAGYSCSETELAQFCTALPRYKRPRRIIFAEVPRNPTGKIEKPKLREKYCSGSLVEAFLGEGL